MKRHEIEETGRMKRRAFLAIFALLATIGLPACGARSDDGKISVVTSTNVWGAVVSAVVKDKASVTAVAVGDIDPHDFELDAKQTAAVVDADIVLVNGSHYDEYLTKAIANKHISTISATKIAQELDSSRTNEHYFYHPVVVTDVVNSLAEELGKKDPTNAQAYLENAQAFNEEVELLLQQLTKISDQVAERPAPGKTIIQTEPLATYLVQMAGLTDVTPASFENEPTAAEIAKVTDLIQNNQVAALIYNTQTVDALTTRLVDLCEQKKINVVRLTETMPTGQTDYLLWQADNIADLAKAVGVNG